MKNGIFSAQELIRFIRTMSNMTQADIAREIGADYKTVNRWINERRAPHPAYYEKLYSLFKERVELTSVIEKIKKQFKNPIAAIHKDKEIYEDFLVQLTYNSNAIEGSTLTLKETEDIIIRNEVLKNKPQKEQQEAINHKTALEHLFFVVKTNFNITGGYVFELHRMIMHGILKDAGKIRKTNVVIRGLAKKLPDHASVSRLMNEFIRDCKKKVDNYPANIAILHHDFEHMHPFTDGNGRVGRLIVITQLLSKGCAPCVIQNSHRREYYNALQMADMRDYKYIVQFVCEGILRGYGILQSNRLEHKKG